jgi:hypothetical protein
MLPISPNADPSAEKMPCPLALRENRCHILGKATKPHTGGRKGNIMIEVTESASKAIKAFMQEKQLDSALRVFLQAGG